MLCIVKQFEKREDDNRELPYYVIRATVVSPFYLLQ